MEQTYDPTLTWIILGGTLIMFLIGREFVCWYWKVNKSISLQEQILAELKSLNQKQWDGPAKF